VSTSMSAHVEFNGDLNHMPLSGILPYICIIAFLVPLPSNLNYTTTNPDNEE